MPNIKKTVFFYEIPAQEEMNKGHIKEKKLERGLFSAYLKPESKV